MKKKITMMLMGMLLLAGSIISPAAVAAAEADDELTASDGIPAVDGLALIVPVCAKVDEEVEMTVLKRSDVSPVEGAGIWVLTRENAEAFNNELAAIATDSAELDDTGIEVMIGVYGELLGRTDDHGKLVTSFSEQGRYVLYAVKQNYLPDRTVIRIGTPVSGLSVNAPRHAVPNEIVDITVTERRTGRAVENAGVWALTRENAEALQSDIQAISETDVTAMTDTDWETLVGVYGVYLGRIDSTGLLQHAFGETGNYLIVAVKNGFIPGRTGIAVHETPRVLTIENDRRVRVNEMVVMTVNERNTGSPVEGAGIWALSREDAATLKEEIGEVRTAAKEAGQDADWEALVSVYGEFLGRTDLNGNVKHEFSETGGYALVAVKNGCVPGFSVIFVVPEETSVSAGDQVKTRAENVRTSTSAISLY